jgi:hypothetical protein
MRPTTTQRVETLRYLATASGMNNTMMATELSVAYSTECWAGHPVDTAKPAGVLLAKR